MENEEQEQAKRILKNLDLFEKRVNEWLKYKDHFGGITVGEWSENKEAQKNDKLIQLRVLFDYKISQIGKNPKDKLIDPNKIEQLIQIFDRDKVHFPLDEKDEVEEYIHKRIVQYLQKLKEYVIIERESNQNYKTLNFKEFVYLCFELKLIDKNQTDRKLQEKDIRKIYEKYEHPMFHNIKLKSPITDEIDIYSVVKTYYSDNKDNNTVNKVKTIIKDLKLISE